ncbi:hypothetical protein I4U23_010166 [Adineta vaga]|nr:hypothetical protein I4U23_010166 [Adineta vaga]
MFMARTTSEIIYTSLSLYEAGSRLFKAGQDDEAEEILTSALSVDNETDPLLTSKIYSVLARIANTRKNYIKAFELSTIAIHLNGTNYEAHLANGVAAYYLGWIEKAIQSFRDGQSHAAGPGTFALWLDKCNTNPPKTAFTIDAEEFITIKDNNIIIFIPVKNLNLNHVNISFKNMDQDIIIYLRVDNNTYKFSHQLPFSVNSELTEKHIFSSGIEIKLRRKLKRSPTKQQICLAIRFISACIILVETVAFYAAIMVSASMGAFVSKMDDTLIWMILLAAIIFHLGATIFTEWKNFSWWKKSF